ncbi:MAG TPA: DUF2892 domain-containing protein [Stenomitos sp.]
MFRPVFLAAFALTLAATPGLAAPMKTSVPLARVEKPVAWVVAPFNNEPQDLMLFGVARVPANEGVLDRVVRLAAGAGLVYAAATQPSWPVAGTAAAYAGGGILAVTGLTGYCALYQPFGISTRF